MSAGPLQGPGPRESQLRLRLSSFLLERRGGPLRPSRAAVRHDAVVLPGKRSKSRHRQQLQSSRMGLGGSAQLGASGVTTIGRFRKIGVPARGRSPSAAGFGRGGWPGDDLAGRSDRCAASRAQRPSVRQASSFTCNVKEERTRSRSREGRPCDEPVAKNFRTRGCCQSVLPVHKY